MSGESKYLVNEDKTKPQKSVVIHIDSDNISSFFKDEESLEVLRMAVGTNFQKK